jgi:hypothetical protein
MTNPPELEVRLRAALAARSAATPGVDPPATFTPPSRPPSTRSLPTVAIAVGLAAAAVVAVAVVDADGSDDADRVVAADDPAAPATTTAPEAPLLGPLPAVLLGDRTPVLVEVGTGTVQPAADPSAAGWHVQVFGSADDPTGPQIQVLTVPHLDADGPDDIVATYTAATTDPVTVQGSPARLQDDGEGFVAVWWPGGGAGGVLIRARGVAADAVVALADGLVPRADGGGWDATVVPDGLTSLVDGGRAGDATTPWWMSNLQYGGDANAGLTFTLAGEVAFAERIGPQAGSTVEPVTVLGRPGVLRTTEYDQAVLWQHDDAVIGELWVTGASRDDVIAAIASLREVTEREWLAAMPEDTFTATEQTALAAEVAPGSPLPSGFDWGEFVTTEDGGSMPATDAVVTAGSDYVGRFGRYALCAWQTTWLEAMDAGDQAGADAARAALEGASSWTVTQLVNDHYAARGFDPANGDVITWDREGIEAGDVEAVRASTRCIG